jgi:sporulation protein YlmC with PRC-barrel domain
MVDVRGWKVMDSDGHELGAVESLMVETDSSNIRWVAVRLSDTMLGGDAGSLNAVLIPVGRVRMLAGQKSLALVSIARDMLLKAPKLPAGAPATREMEDATLKLFGIATSNELPKGDLYGTPAFDAKLGLLTPGVATGA